MGCSGLLAVVVYSPTMSPSSHRRVNLFSLQSGVTIFVSYTCKYGLRIRDKENADVPQTFDGEQSGVGVNLAYEIFVGCIENVVSILSFQKVFRDWETVSLL